MCLLTQKNERIGFLNIYKLEIRYTHIEYYDIVIPRVYLFDEFLSEKECDGLIKAHDSHVKALDHQPLLCFDSITTLRSHLKDVNKSVKVTPNDFTQG